MTSLLPDFILLNFRNRSGIEPLRIFFNFSAGDFASRIPGGLGGEIVPHGVYYQSVANDLFWIEQIDIK